MLTKRTLLLLVPALFASYVAAAQSPAAAAGPTPASLLGLAAWGVAAVVLLFGVMTAASLAAVAADAMQNDTDQHAAAPAATPMNTTAAPAATQQRVAA